MEAEFNAVILGIDALLRDCEGMADSTRQYLEELRAREIRRVADAMVAYDNGDDITDGLQDWEK
jgi:hypothetical protein